MNVGCAYVLECLLIPKLATPVFFIAWHRTIAGKNSGRSNVFEQIWEVAKMICVGMADNQVINCSDAVLRTDVFRRREVFIRPTIDPMVVTVWRLNPNAQAVTDIPNRKFEILLAHFCY